MFQINQLPNDYSSAQIVSTKPLKDRYGNYTLTIEASDLGEPTKSVREDMSICVTDYNDHAPLFVSPPQNVTIRIPEVKYSYRKNILDHFEDERDSYPILSYCRTLQ